MQIKNVTAIFEALGWAQKESIPTQVLGKYVKEGGAITVTTAEEIFAFRGQRSKEFYKYTSGTWTLMESIPFGYKPGTTTINRKYPR